MGARTGPGWQQIQASPAFAKLRSGLRRLQWQGRDVRPELRLNTAELHHWVFYPAALSPRSVVYTIGVDGDIRFDLAMIAEFGADVHVFDPMPDTAGWIASKALPAKFTFHRWAAAGRDGELSVRRGARDDNTDLARERVRAYSLRTLMKKLRHAHVDLLKINIGTQQCAVLDDLVLSNVRPGQLLLGFHDCNSAQENSVRATIIRRLRAIGYRVFSVSDTGREISLLLSTSSLNATT